jgi:hypothetical protein
VPSGKSSQRSSVERRYESPLLHRFSPCAMTAAVLTNAGNEIHPLDLGRRQHHRLRLTDNGSVYTSRFTYGHNDFDRLQARLGIAQKNDRPGSWQRCCVELSLGAGRYSVGPLAGSASRG